MSLLDTIRFITSHPLNREQKLKSIIRFAKWQIGSRLVRGEIVYDWINGSKFLVKTGDKGLTGNIYTGLHEFPDMGFLLHFLRVDDLFVDIGANVGSYTILACCAVGARGVAFEPVPSTYKKLVENMRINHLEARVDCVNKGVGSQPGSIAFTSGIDTKNHVLAAGEHCADQIVVDVIALDAALAELEPSLIKIDVEGYETLVLEGAQQTLAKPSLQALIIELNGSGRRYGFDESKILDFMSRNGFSTYSYDPLIRKLVDLEGKNLASGNTLFIRNKAFVENRLRLAAPLSLHGKHF
ncbi:MAG: FkbM family methyltransferase [Cyanobium sp.]|jgi:FkbM family methyltransferase